MIDGVVWMGVAQFCCQSCPDQHLSWQEAVAVAPIHRRVAQQGQGARGGPNQLPSLELRPCPLTEQRLVLPPR